MKKRVLLLFIYLVSFSNLFSQISGKILDQNENLPLSNVLIKSSNDSQWILSDAFGKFNFPVKSYPVTLKFHLLGKIDFIKTYNTPLNNQLIVLKDDNLTIDEVVVVAKRKKESTGSNLVIEKQAINIVQAQSVADVMQLIPGKNITETALHERQILTLRSAIFNENQKFNENKGLGNNNNEYLLNNAFGIGYIVDGVPINNNVNLTGSRSTRLGIFSNLTQNNSVGIGLDLKNLSLDNIESIDIVQGISSAKYGDHNTGLVKINKAHGYTPYRINTTLRGGSLGTTLTKGFELSNDNGYLNIGLDYLKSDNDPRNSISKFDRINSNISWSYKKKGTFKNTLNLAYSQNINADNSVVNSLTDRRKKVDNKRFRFSNNSHWNYSSAFFQEFSGLISLDYSDNKTSSSLLINNGGQPILNNFIEGTFEANYTPVSFRAIENIENKPLSIFTRLELLKQLKYRNTTYDIHIGTSLGVDNNFGRGNYTEANKRLHATANETGNVGFRNINFNDLVPTDIKFSSYVTATIKSKLFSRNWKTDLGIRYDNYNSQSTFSPRLNTTLQINKKLKTRFGIGLFAKSPSLQTLFPGNIYYDYVLSDFRTNNYSFALGHTFVREYTTPNIKPSKTIKLESGLDYYNNFLNLSLTSYYNKQHNGFTSYRTFEIANLPQYSYTFYPDKKPDYILTGTSKTILDYSRPTNSLESENLGIEILIGTKKIKSINTSFNINAAYRFTKTFSNLPNYRTSQESDSEVFIGLHKPVSQKYQTLNSSITATHHVSSIGLIVTLTAEQFIMAKNSNDGAIQFPYAYYDRDLNLFSIPESEQSNTKYIPVIRNLNETVASSSNIPSVYTNYHLRLAKEFKNGLRFSFYAVNFLNHLPKAEIKNNSGEITLQELNTPISFGGSITYKF